MLAFRLSGAQLKINNTAEPVPASVEILYRQIGRGYQAILAWIPVGAQASPPPPSATLASGIDRAGLDTVQFVALSSSNVRITGFTVFEQFKQGASTHPHLCLPLVARRNAHVCSELVFSEAAPRFQLHLGLPSPISYLERERSGVLELVFHYPVVLDILPTAQPVEFELMRSAEGGNVALENLPRKSVDRINFVGQNPGDEELEMKSEWFNVTNIMEEGFHSLGLPVPDAGAIGFMKGRKNLRYSASSGGATIYARFEVLVRRWDLNDHQTGFFRAKGGGGRNFYVNPFFDRDWRQFRGIPLRRQGGLYKVMLEHQVVFTKDQIDSGELNAAVSIGFTVAGGEGGRNGLAELINQPSNTARLATQNNDAELPVSFAPHIKIKQDQNVGNKLQMVGDIRLTVDARDGATWVPPAHPPVLTFREREEVSCQFSFPGYSEELAVDAVLGRDEAGLGNLGGQRGEEFKLAPPYTAAFSVSGSSVASAGTVRASLDGIFFTHIESGKVSATATAWLRLVQRPPWRSFDSLISDFEPSAFDFRMPVAVAGFTPAAVGAATGGDGEVLLIPLDTINHASSVLLLDVHESVSADLDRELSVELRSRRKPETNEDTQRYAIVGSSPFVVAKTTMKRLAARINRESTDIAYWSSVTRGWKFNTQDRPYQYTFPPQTIGEAMDKPWPEGTADAAKIVDYIEGSAAGGDAQTMLQRKLKALVDFRLSTPADLWIYPSDIGETYSPPEWELGALFSGRGAEGTGVALASLRAEFLYGMNVAVQPERETGISRLARVAEIGALSGDVVDQPTGRDDEPPSFENFKQQWARLSEAVHKRPARFDVWAGEFGTPALFLDSTRFALRKSAALAHPIPDEYHNSNTGVPDQFDLYPEGLRGGVFWPIESVNVLNELLRDPHSSGGRLENVAVSAIGGWAEQKALFNGGKTRVVSKTTAGFLERLAIERIGRIGALWHRAKHVIVYERTVLPSLQFDDDTETTERPVLRKVEEYVELLQPERSYPDFEDVEERFTGFLRTVRFKTTIIPVDSRWGGDVGTLGWRVPLWNRKDAKLKPQIYSRPDVHFVTEGEEGELTDQSCMQPDKLNFFTDTRDGTTDDTDAWVPTAGVDFIDVINPKEADEIAAPVDLGRDPDRRRASPNRSAPGSGRFTWKLQPGDQKTRLNAARQEKPLYAALDSVTFMRCEPTAAVANDYKQLYETIWGGAGLGDGPSSDQIDDLNGMFQNVAFVRSAIDNFDDSGGNFGALKAEILGLLKNKAKPKLQSDAGRPVPPNVKNWVDEVSSQFSGIDDKIPENVKKYLGLDGGLPDLCGSLKKKLQQQIRRHLPNITEILDDLERWLNATLDRIDPGQPQAWVNEIFGPPDDGALGRFIREGVGRGLVPITLTLDSVEDDIADLRGDLDALEEDLVAAVNRVESRILQSIQSFEGSKPWSDNRRRLLQDQIDKEVKRLELEARSIVESVLNEASARSGQYGRQALNYLKAAVSEKVGEWSRAYLQPASSGLEAGIAGARVFFAKNWLKIERALSKARARLDAGELRDEVDRLIGEAQNLSALIDATDAEIQAQQEKVSTLLTDLGAVIAQIETDATEVIDDALRSVFVEVRALQQHIDRLFILIQHSDVNLRLVALENYLRNQVITLNRQAKEVIREGNDTLDVYLNKVEEHLAALRDATNPAAVSEFISRPIQDFASNKLRPKVQEIVNTGTDVENRIRAEVNRSRDLIVKDIEAFIDKIESSSNAIIDEAAAICNDIAVPINDAVASLNDMLTNSPLKEYVDSVTDLIADIEGIADDLDELKDRIKQTKQLGKQLKQDVELVKQEFEQAADRVKDYGEGVTDAIGRLGDGGLAQAPNNILRLYSAFADAPKLPSLDFATDRLRYYFDATSDIVNNTPVAGLFDQFGDELKGLGLTLPVDGFGDNLIPQELKDFDINQIFKNFGGLNLGGLFDGLSVPEKAKDHIKVTHQFDKDKARAWVQVTIDMPLDPRMRLFELAIFRADVVHGRFKAFLRLEASAQSSEVSREVDARIFADIEMSVGGQVMVALREALIRFEQPSGLKFDFDPSKIEINRAMKTVNDALSTFLGSIDGGLELITRGAIPVGISHTYITPPINLSYGTSGISNLALSNRFELIAFPDFVLIDRFSLSSPDRPFIFAVWIIGGSGWLTFEAEYLPVDRRLSVLVDAAIGGSAFIGFAFAGVNGSVSISIAANIQYRKVLGQSGGGLSLGMVVTIRGEVNVLSIVNAYIVILLSFTYRENGDIDATGRLTLKIKICRFFTIKVSAGVSYQMRGGQESTQTESSAETGVAGRTLSQRRSRS